MKPHKLERKLLRAYHRYAANTTEKAYRSIQCAALRCAMVGIARRQRLARVSPDASYRHWCIARRTLKRKLKECWDAEAIALSALIKHGEDDHQGILTKHTLACLCTNQARMDLEDWESMRGRPMLSYFLDIPGGCIRYSFTKS